MKKLNYIYQAGSYNKSAPSLVSQTEPEAVQACKDMSEHLGIMVSVYHPGNGIRLVTFDNGICVGQHAFVQFPS